VLDEGSGPIPGAVVTAGMGYPWNSTPGVPRLDRQFVAIADDDGRYQLTLEPREYRLRVQAAGYVPAETSVAVTRPVTRDLRLGPAARISGRVVERASGQPVADAEVILSGSSRDFANHRNTRTDDQGRFVIDDASAGAFELSARHRDRKLFGRGAKVVTIATQAIEGQEIALSAGVQLAGRVRDAAGKGIPGVPVTIWPLDWTLTERPRVVSEADGRFSVALSGPGRFQVGAEAVAPSDPRGETTVVVGPQGLDSVDLVLAAAPEATAVVGRVLDPAGRPVGGALVRSEHPGSARGWPDRGPAESSPGRHPSRPGRSA
jgi:protocatechuate 3,4-dioxygenase beta subunit